MAARRTQAPGKPITGLILAISAAVACYGVYPGYPGLLAVWAGLLVNAWMYPPAMFTGSKDSRGYPTPSHPGEQAAMNTFRFWEDLKYKLAIPSLDWLPGLNLRLPFLAAVWTGAAASLLPVTDTYTGGWGPLINAAAAYVAIMQVTASRRRTVVADDDNPGARMNSLIALSKTQTPKVIGLGIGGILLGAVIGTVASVFIPLGTAAARLPAIPEPAIWALCLSGGPLLFLSRPWVTAALDHWRVVVAAREDWKPRWTMLKHDPEPRLLDHREVGPAIIETFDAPAAVGAMVFRSLGPKIVPTLGSGVKVAVLSTPDLDSNNQPVPGTINPRRFEIARWPADQIPDITDPSTPKEVVAELVRSSLVWVGEGAGGVSPALVDDVHLLTAAADGQAPGPHAWAVTWRFPEGPTPLWVRQNGLGALSGLLGTDALVDHRAMGGAGCLYLGDLLNPGTQWDPSTGVTTETMQQLADEDIWDQRWTEVSKMGTNPPVIQHPVVTSAKLRSGATIHYVPFVTRQGMPPSDFFALEPKMATVLGAAPFVTMTGFHDPGRRPGERHPQAFVVCWADTPVPTRPDDLPPNPGSEAPKWLLAGLINHAFRVSRLAERPEVAAVTCLTKPESRRHIWRIDLRLYGGVTLAEVRGAAQKIRQHWSSEWLRITDSPDGCSIFVGAKPAKVKLTNPRQEKLLAALDWDQAFLDSKVSGIGGFMPKLANVSHLPSNDKVQVLDFELPPNSGLDYTMIKAATEKLKAATDNLYVDVQRTSSASTVRILTCTENPMPERVDFDFDAVDNSGKLIPFATGVEGEPIMFDPITSPHALLAGVTRSGKSVLAQGFVYGMLTKGALVFIIDPMKAAADFVFARNYAAGFAVDIFEAAATLKAVYKIVTERKKVNAAMGVGSYHELSDPPPPLVVLIDEFTSLMQKEVVPPPSDDQEEEEMREEIIAINRAKQEIGTFTGKLAREAASAGVNLLLGTQKLSAKMLDTVPGGGDLKTNLARTLLGSASSGDRMSALRDFDSAPPVGNPIPKGRGLWEPLDHSAVVIQTWYASQDRLTDELQARLPDLPDGDKPDITPYLRRPAVPGEPAEDAIVDLGEIELSLDDLDWSAIELSDEDTGEGDVEPGTEPTATAGTVVDIDPVDAVSETVGPVDDSVAILLDVDGVITAFGRVDDSITIDSVSGASITYRPAVVQRLAILPIHQLWLTSRGEDVVVDLGKLLPRATEVLDAASSDHGWWKIDAAVAWLAAHPGVTKVVWADDELSTEDEVLGVDFLDIAREAFAAAGVDALLIPADPMTGLTDGQLQTIESFCTDSAAIYAPEVMEEAPTMEFDVPEPFLAPTVQIPVLPSLGEDDPFQVKVPARRTAILDEEDPFD
ncbi:FtsK/SpoIIIE domain-containing protein [Arthrobacter sp. A2-55]|uniref:FtsK/SpoIIIE domain-containing protein n=1 Tax=Arthrobacter sp. A2-55 TaxID=2897337 RepID=UPI0021CD97F8|nr:FtsK/SpoIIIE domain-containing protein [Arthrobacter sp. A2-55]MCU6481916.1 cell division protein FtsK [Arthrobacter sp. A2-55]